MNHKIINKTILVFTLLITVVLTSCSGTKTVKVTLTDFKIQSSLTEFKVGVPYHFVVSNEGASNHEFMIMPPVDPSMNMSMEEMDDMALGMIEDSDLVPGATLTLDITFTDPAPDGTLEFACHTAKHYEAGMVLPITVQ